MLEKSRKNIEISLGRIGRKLFKGDERKIEEYVMASMSRIQSSTKLNDALKISDLVIEAIIENLNEKQK